MQIVDVYRQRKFNTSLPHIHIGFRHMLAVPAVGDRIAMGPEGEDIREVTDVIHNIWESAAPGPSPIAAEVWVQ